VATECARKCAHPRYARKVKVFSAAAGVVLAVGVVVRELSHGQGSGVVVVLAAAVALGCLSALLTAWERWREEQRRRIQSWQP